MINLEKSINLIKSLFPENKIKSVNERGYWVKEKSDLWNGKYVIYFTLNNNKRYCIKFGELKDAEDFKAEIGVINIFLKNNIPAPKIIKTDFTLDKINCIFYIVEYLEGIKLSTLWLQSDREEKNQVYNTLGKLFNRIHSIHSENSGLISGEDPYKVRYLGVFPTEYMFNAEIVNGSGKKALEEGYLSKENYEAVIKTWEQNMSYLKDHQPTLIHYSSFCWTISFLKEESEWYISKLTGLGDVLWWDPVCNLALIKYPPFMKIDNLNWKSFLKGYQNQVDEKKVAIYALLIKISAAMGTYYEPDYLSNNYIKENLNKDIKYLLDNI
ncbi:phosphotransferase [Herbivorax sp. ANBcel31]|uniref:phosphotransferase n=1 Tax=Herbivorax sp. ANBcel31 TaxID=3069754 RepID=UPI0027B47A75|nr:phosphotransferase [Herbivorax sp. ANBcel31]MDQ2086325.1 phosphotransferase [Herbivorax sp. ANBcel31]